MIELLQFLPFLAFLFLYLAVWNLRDRVKVLEKNMLDWAELQQNVNSAVKDTLHELARMK